MLSIKVQLFSRKWNTQVKSQEMSLYFLVGIISTILICGAIVVYLLRAPYTYESWSQFTVFSGEPVESVVQRLDERGFVRSSFLARLLMKYRYSGQAIRKGVYHLEDPKSLPDLLNLFFVQGPHKPLVQFTVPEGSDDEEVIAIVTRALPAITASDMRLAIRNASATGLLFPDTYYPDEDANATTVVRTMVNQFIRVYRKTFNEKIDPYHITEDQKELISFAAILEGEVRRSYDMKLVSGVLHNRILKGMKLQVDADRRTYKGGGTFWPPINNPGQETLEASQTPIITDYLFYLTGRDGKFYYAKNYEEHVININRYLR